MMHNHQALADQYSYENHDGYVESAQQEQEKYQQRTIQFQTNPVQQVSTEMNQKIFTREISQEFRNRYKEKFGQTRAEQALEHPEQYTYYEGNSTGLDGKNPQGSFRGLEEQKYEEEKNFGKFMVKRLAEYHVEGYLKSKPTIQKVYALKETVSKVDLKISKKVKVKFRYQLSGNYIRLRFDNPWIYNYVLLEMNPDDFGPSEVTDVVVAMQKNINSKTRIETFSRFMSGTYSIVGRRSLSSNTSFSLTGRTNRIYADSNNLEDYEVDHLFLAGFNWVY